MPVAGSTLWYSDHFIVISTTNFRTSIWTSKKKVNK